MGKETSTLAEAVPTYRQFRGVVSSKGQITIPKEVRDRLGLQPGAEIEFEFRDGGALLHQKRPVRHPVWGMIGSLKATWPEYLPKDVDKYIDLVRGGSYEELTRGIRRKRKQRHR
ncbi:MAG: AbrB/MazE/SpoVT family DNA-binding domain-containing protein [Fimbriimonadales bacterium]